MTAATGTVTAPMTAQTGQITSDATVAGQLEGLQQQVQTAVAAGQNLPLAAVKLLSGKKVTPFHSYKLGTIFVRTIEEHICSFEALGNLTTRGSLIYHNKKKGNS